MITIDVHALADTLVERLRDLLPAPEPARSPWLDVGAAADYLNLSREAMRGLIKRGDVPFYKPNGRVFLHRDDLDRWVRSGATTP
jgi:excisionase family DNA binding protein